MTSFFSDEELKSLGLKGYGKNVKISRKASFYSVENILLGDNVRIDDFCVLSGNITIGNNVHISAFCALYGKYGIEFQDYSGCSTRTTIYSETDDFSGEYMIGAVLPDELTNVYGSKVIISKFAQLGANNVVLPGVIVKEGAVTGALTFVNKDLEEWTINCGIPCRILKNRSKKMLELLKNSNE